MTTKLTVILPEKASDGAVCGIFRDKPAESERQRNERIMNRLEELFRGVARRFSAPERKPKLESQEPPRKWPGTMGNVIG